MIYAFYFLIALVMHQFYAISGATALPRPCHQDMFHAIGDAAILHEQGISKRLQLVNHAEMDHYWIQETLLTGNQEKSPLLHPLLIPIHMDMYPKNAFIASHGDLVALLGRYLAEVGSKSTATILALYDRQHAAQQPSKSQTFPSCPAAASNDACHTLASKDLIYVKRCQTLERLGPLNASWFYMHEETDLMIAVKEDVPFPQLVLFSMKDCTLRFYFPLASRHLSRPIFNSRSGTLYFLCLTRLENNAKPARQQHQTEELYDYKEQNPNSLNDKQNLSDMLELRAREEQSRNASTATPISLISLMLGDIGEKTEFPSFHVLPFPKKYQLHLQGGSNLVGMELSEASSFQLMCPLLDDQWLVIDPESSHFSIIYPPHAESNK
jgi:hypothetical protein